MQEIATLRGELASYETHYAVQKLYELRTKVNEEENNALSKLAYIRDIEKRIQTLRKKIEEVQDQAKGQIKKPKLHTVVIKIKEICSFFFVICHLSFPFTFDVVIVLFVLPKKCSENCCRFFPLPSSPSHLFIFTFDILPFFIYFQVNQFV
ncbi:hypothetical protein RFI_17016 [Reticulomyxa filosa]|uniref:Uncharacterized protein n=1 Tax=Reticulomyxa filosa TaxID=46433 RepID=X6N1Q3_RETFI|nr:hypothetical protein RFI_17016 [Reticulomyxa filosa]|eukprot:ETO20205.1 hypothetical protein RFI_17016 [Reticulomyxa filosa]